MHFKELNLIEPILKALEDKNYTEPTPIQEKAIPIILEKNDVLGCAQTGTGKTAAFAIPIIQLINENAYAGKGKINIKALIVTPTRELAIQIDENVKAYCKHTTIRNTVIFGGVKQGKQVNALKNGVHILVATPGRLLDLIEKKNILASAIHGNKSQNQRQKALKDFKDKKVKVLVATDIAARGIDIDKLQYVVNYDIPNIAETYVHRIGRSGRAGESGVSISICEPEENYFVRDIEKLIGKKIDKVDNHPFPQTDKPMNAEERRQANKEKQRKKQEFFANRKKNKSGGKSTSGRNNNSRKPKRK
ncbi:UNVERIFIED_CONTAM: hypothetical protein GTU68_045110 [Idotea baltica]|nr:hypothetical protein [Idotea baltica]